MAGAKIQNITSHNIAPLAKNVPAKYRNCPADLLWAVPMDLAQDSSEFKAWIEPIKIKAKADTDVWLREQRKSKFKIIK